MKEQIRITEAEAPLRVAGWRNLFVTVSDEARSKKAGPFPVGYVLQGEILHPTKAAAEAMAAPWIERCRGHWEYLGAFEEAA